MVPEVRETNVLVGLLECGMLIPVVVGFVYPDQGGGRYLASMMRFGRFALSIETLQQAAAVRSPLVSFSNFRPHTVSGEIDGETEG